jgi:transcriptional regulator with XRE-family HTH domain
VTNYNKSLSEEITKTDEGMLTWQQERIIFEVTERICELMEAQEVSRAELASRLGTTKGYISQLLDGTANMTLRTLSDVFLRLGRSIHVDDGPASIEHDSPSLCYDFTIHGKVKEEPGGWNYRKQRFTFSRTG